MLTPSLSSPKPRISCRLPRYPSLCPALPLATAFRPFISPFSVASIYVNYFIGFTPRSLHISFARTSCISECLGIAERFLRIGLCHQECLASSLGKPHPWPLEGFITPADEKRARVGWISEAHPPSLPPGGCAALIHPTAPNRGCCFIVKRGVIPLMPG
uniref:Uncharacterized protein n=1 Tax=Candidatus Kentrum sp. UNK TaxID=2126344 RepID=A0A451B0Z1_9GAMM|nr:MAG: hypothetical protein BECKUNK1418G_GA0071005_10878 [Candidatus Kentron sp. UNK]VFK71945.1 MAG: hypothetical protein BECKUNK1418H_GA0071006_10888 [Candidatus Kentron sp. UNK]